MDEGDPRKKIEGMTRVVLRPLASPPPLAFFAFGAGSLVLGGLQLGMVPASETRSVALIQAASGVLGCVIAAIAIYGALALGLEDLQGKAVLPIGRRGAVGRAFGGDLGEQVGPIESEAGVRKQL